MTSRVPGTFVGLVLLLASTCDCDPAVHGGWTDWSNWSPCTVSCGTGGERMRSRSCDNPPPSNGGQACEGDSSDTSDCDPATQPTCCTWTAWETWGTCFASPCSGGFRLRSRDRVGDQDQCSSLTGNFVESELCIAGCTGTR